MRSRGVVGKRIASIEQSFAATRSSDRFPDKVWIVTVIVLEDGTRLVPSTVETDFGEYYHVFSVHKEVPRAASR